MSDGRYFYASTEMPGRARRALDLATSWIEASHDVRKLVLPATHAGPGDHLGLPDLFNATPDALIESWRVAQVVDNATDPGDTVIISDRQGIAGVLALEQAMRLPADRRRIVVVAGESTYLRFRSHAGTADGLAPELQAEVDWEIASYRWADAVVTPSSWVRDELAAIGVGAQWMLRGDAPQIADMDLSATNIWLPEPVVRASRIGTILRAINIAGRDGVVTLSPSDGPDEVWSGTTWDALDGLRLIHTSHLERDLEPDAPELIILGDRTAVPEASVIGHVRSGVPVLVPEGSTAAGMWPRAKAWRDFADLVECLTNRRASPTEIREPAVLQIPELHGPAQRADSISVGVPVFRDVRFLPECVNSILGQTEPPAEILIYDDGSNLDSVDVALRDLENLDNRIRILSGPNQGVCVARNRLLEAMAGDAFVFVDADDMLEPTFLRKTANALRSQADVAAVATWTRFFGTYEAVEGKPPFDARVGMRENPIISTCVLTDMKVRELGVRFAPDLAWMFCEDWHVWSQIIAAGERFGLIPEPLAKHRVHLSGGHRRTELAYSLGRARATRPLN